MTEPRQWSPRSARAGLRLTAKATANRSRAASRPPRQVASELHGIPDRSMPPQRRGAVSVRPLSHSFDPQARIVTPDIDRLLHTTENTGIGCGVAGMPFAANDRGALDRQTN